MKTDTKLDLPMLLVTLGLVVVNIFLAIKVVHQDRVNRLIYYQLKETNYTSYLKSLETKNHEYTRRFFEVDRSLDRIEKEIQ